MKQLSNKRFTSRLDRIEKLTDLLEQGIAPTEAAQQLGVRWETVQSDMELMPELARGLLSPETCAKKRTQIDKNYSEMYAKLVTAFNECVEDGLHKQAGTYSKSITELLKAWQILWGLPDAKVETLGAGNLAGGKISFTKVDVNVSKEDLDDIRKVVSRRTP